MGLSAKCRAKNPLVLYKPPETPVRSPISQPKLYQHLTWCRTHLLWTDRSPISTTWARPRWSSASNPRRFPNGFRRRWIGIEIATPTRTPRDMTEGNERSNSPAVGGLISTDRSQHSQRLEEPSCDWIGKKTFWKNCSGHRRWQRYWKGDRPGVRRRRRRHLRCLAYRDWDTERRREGRGGEFRSSPWYIMCSRKSGTLKKIGGKCQKITIWESMDTVLLWHYKTIQHKLFLRIFHSTILEFLNQNSETKRDASWQLSWISLEYLKKKWRLEEKNIRQILF